MRRTLSRTWMVLLEAYQGFNRHGGSTMAAAVSLYALLSLTPIVLLALTVLGRLLGAQEAQAKIIGLITSAIPAPSDRLIAAVQSLSLDAKSPFVYVVGIGGLLWSATTLPAGMSLFLTISWIGRPQRGLVWRRFVALLIITVAGVLSLLSVALSAGAAAIAGNPQRFGFLSRAVRVVGPPLGGFVSLLFLILTLFILYRFLPATRVLSRAALLGAGVGAMLLHVLRIAFTALVVQSARYGRIYGPLAGVVILLLWVYYSATILLASAEIAAAYQRRHESGWTSEQPSRR